MLSEQSGIYAIVNVIDGKAYIGSTNNFRSRWRGHKCDLRNQQHCNRYLQNAWNKYGSDNFVFVVIRLVPTHVILFVEQFYLDQYQCLDWCYNIAPKADVPYCEMTDERRKSLSNQAKKQWAENREKMIASLRGVKKCKLRDMAVEMTPEWCENISKAKMGKRIRKPRTSEHTRNNIESRRRGREKLKL